MNWEIDARMMFRKIDVNSDGALDQPELSSMLSDIGLVDSYIEQIFMQLDSDGDGQVARHSYAYHELDDAACADIGARVRNWIPRLSDVGCLAGGQRNATEVGQVDTTKDTTHQGIALAKSSSPIVIR